MPTQLRLKEVLDDFDSMDITLEEFKAQVEKLVYAATIRLGNAQGVIM